MLVENNANHFKYKLRLETWSPVHIGSGKKLTRWEYYIDINKKMLYYLDYNKLADVAVKEPQFIDNLTKEASGNDNKASLNTFLDRVPNKKNQILGLSRSFNLQTNKVRELNLLVGSPRPYLPGSSIKGALRTAFLVNHINDKQLSLPKDIIDASAEIKNTFKIGSKHNALFNNLIIHDSPFIHTESIVIGAIRLFASKKNNNASQHDLFCEVIDSQFETTIEVIDKRKQSTGIKEILEFADKFYREVWKQEVVNRQKTKDNDLLDYYDNEDFVVPNDKYLLRIGFGSGQLATSILMEYKKLHKDDSNLRVGPTYRNNYDLKKRDPYPYTAKAVSIEGVYDPFGWVVVDKW